VAQWRRNEFESGPHVRREAPEIFFRALHFFGSTSTISRFCERFRDGQYSLVSFLFAVLLLIVPTTLRAQPYVKVLGTCTRALWSMESAPLRPSHRTA